MTKEQLIQANELTKEIETLEEITELLHAIQNNEVKVVLEVKPEHGSYRIEIPESLLSSVYYFIERAAYNKLDASRREFRNL